MGPANPGGARITIVPTQLAMALASLLLVAAGCSRPLVSTQAVGTGGSVGITGAGAMSGSAGGAAPVAGIGGSGGGTSATGGGGATVTCAGLGGSTAQCGDGIDNDNDGKIDYDDPECLGPADNDESSFADGIPGDNNTDACKQDCAFDGNSGMGDDLCLWQSKCDPLSTRLSCPYDPLYAMQHANE